MEPSARVSRIEPPSMRPGLSTICRIERAVTDLAGAGFADDAERLAALQLEGDAVDGLEDAGAGREMRS